MHPTSSRRPFRSSASGTSRIAPWQGLREAPWLVGWRDRSGGGRHCSTRIRGVRRPLPGGVVLAASRRCAARRQLFMATHALGYAPEDPVCLVESCRRAIEWILITHVAHGRLVARPWIDHPYGEEEITLLEEERLLEGW
jgi:hypothetical protein